MCTRSLSACRACSRSSRCATRAKVSVAPSRSCTSAFSASRSTCSATGCSCTASSACRGSARSAAALRRRSRMWVDVLRDAAPHAHASRVSALRVLRARRAPDPRVLRELMRIGAPIAGSMLAEGGLFVAAALMMGAMGATIASGHQIALNYASFMFMVPLAISSATTIHVGHTLGRGDAAGARAAGALGIVHVRHGDVRFGDCDSALQRSDRSAVHEAMRRCANSRRRCC